ncbi:LysE family translocator [Christiangramia salexigens]|uniref:Lysine transporter LysE n=1 Tax=Christiangramia salexigens TaxID=1913577 RepID=A0A1L3J5N9_9FLAO|nr:LysE family transporter [Christiangramia salexigens]APG60458.1 lysine transporter LysE [Christiangramia salexigens]
MEETKLFLITYFAAFLGVIPPGLVNMTVAKTCVERGKKNGIYVAVGAALVVLIQALIAVLLAKYIFDHPLVRRIFLRAGLVIFIILGIYFFIKAKSKKAIRPSAKKANANSILKGMLVAVLNVFPIPYFVAIAGAMNVNHEMTYDWSVSIAFALAACLGSFTTLYLYVFSFAKIEEKVESFAKYSNYFMAGLMLILIVITLIRMYNF